MCATFLPRHVLNYITQGFPFKVTVNFFMSVCTHVCMIPQSNQTSVWQCACPLQPIVFNPHQPPPTMAGTTVPPNASGEPCVCVYVHCVLCYYVLVPLNLIRVHDYCYTYIYRHTSGTWCVSSAFHQTTPMHFRVNYCNLCDFHKSPDL